MKKYRWNDLSPVIRQYVVVDERGRYGIGSVDPNHGDDVIFAHPASVGETLDSTQGVPGAETLPSNAIVMTDTAFHRKDDGSFSGFWFDEQENCHIRIVSDLGYKMPDRVADFALAGSDEMGHWDYGAKLGKVGGEPPVKGQKSKEMTVQKALEYAVAVGEKVTKRGIRKAANSGYILDARKVGRDWLIPYNGFNHYLDNRPKRGRKPIK